MDPGTLALIGEFGGGAINGISNLLGTSAAQLAQNQNFQQWMQLAIPDPQQQQLALKQLQSTGTLSPALTQAIQQQPSAFNQIVQNAQYAGAKNQALSQLQQIGNSGGLNLQDQSQQEQALQASQMQANGNRDAINDQLAQRGLTNSGFGVQAQLANRQNQAQQDANTSLQTAANAQQRGLQAIQDAGNLAGNYANQDYSQQAAAAQSQNAINNFNAQNLQNVNSANTAAQNYAQQYNLQNNQNIANQNVGISNEEQQYNKGLAQQQFNNQVTQLQGATGANDKGAALSQTAGQQIGNVASNFGAQVANNANNQANQNFWAQYLKQNNGS